MARKHYHVVENTPGYLPDSDEPSPVFTRRDEAGRYAYELAQELRDSGYVVCGNQRDGYRGEDRSKMYDLGRVIEIIPCTEEECMGHSEE